MTCRSFRVPLVLAILALPTTFQSASARILDVFDIDSLAYMSPEVVEAEIVKRYDAHKVDVIDVKVTAVHKGEAKVGQTVPVAHTDVYRKDDLKSVEHLA